jgi:uncharacterized protein
MNVKNIFVLALVIILLTIGIYFFLVKENIKESEIINVCINDECFSVKEVSTDLERKTGLSNYDFLNENEGMIFVFKEEGKYGFWMKDMNFPIDIIWINKNLEVVDFVENVTPCSENCVSYLPQENSIYVLEISAGKINELKITKQDKFTLVRQ